MSSRDRRSSVLKGSAALWVAIMRYISSMGPMNRAPRYAPPSSGKKRSREMPTAKNWARIGMALLSDSLLRSMDGGSQKSQRRRVWMLSNDCSVVWLGKSSRNCWVNSMSSPRR